MRYVFDIETDGLLDKATKIHSLVLYNIDTDEVFSCADDQRFLSLQKGLRLLENAELLIGHNIICFDLPALKKLYGLEVSAEIFDTLNACRLIWPDVLETDAKLKQIPTPLYGKHSLEAWGTRIGHKKGDYGATTDWKSWSLPMQKYCENDVELNVKLYRKIQAKNYSKRALDLEMEFQDIIAQQERNGVCFDKAAAMKMYYQLRKDCDKFKADLQEMVGPIVKETPFIPKRDNKTKGYKKGVTFIKRSYSDFNCGSRTQIAEFLIKKYKWEPKEFTPTGRPKCSSDIIGKLPYEEAGIIAKYLTANKLLGMLGEGDKAWLRLERNGRLYGRMITNGTVTGRCSHQDPNLGQVPNTHAFLGAECRQLFKSSPGKVLVGADAKAIELRMLAHFLHPYDNGDYAKEILNGDIHCKNQASAELPTRDTAKRFIFAMCYGAGDELLGSIIDPKASREIHQRKGTRARIMFYRNIPAFEKLKRNVEHTAKTRGHLIGLDGRHLPIRESYRALNTLLQSSGAITMKMANCIFWRMIKERKLAVWQVLQVHDEISIECAPEIAQEVSDLLVDAIILAGEEFKLSIPLDGESKIGKNWMECH